MADDEVPTNMALMAFSDFELQCCSTSSYRVIFTPKLDLSNSGLEEFQQPEFEGYGPKTSKSVSEDISNKVRESPDAPKIIKFVRPKQQEKPVRKSVKYAEVYRPKAVNTARPNSAVVNAMRANQVNAVKASACHSSKKTRSSQDYILMPLWKDGSLFDSSSKNASNDEPQPSSDAGKKDDEGVNKESGINDQERPKNSTQDVNTAGKY
ncbi:hypothetical protein Tco_0694610 [Tanacetum coccineum]